MSQNGGREPSGGEWVILLIVFMFCLCVVLLCMVIIR